MSIRITDTEMVVTIDEKIAAAARHSQRAAADGTGVWIRAIHELITWYVEACAVG